MEGIQNEMMKPVKSIINLRTRIIIRVYVSSAVCLPYKNHACCKQILDPQIKHECVLVAAAQAQLALQSVLAGTVCVGEDPVVDLVQN